MHYRLDSYTISLESFRSFRCPLFRKPVTGQELFFTVSYSKPALVFSFKSSFITAYINTFIGFIKSINLYNQLPKWVKETFLLEKKMMQWNACGWYMTLNARHLSVTWDETWFCYEFHGLSTEKISNWASRRYLETYSSRLKNKHFKQICSPKHT